MNARRIMTATKRWAIGRSVIVVALMGTFGACGCASSESVSVETTRLASIEEFSSKSVTDEQTGRTAGDSNSPDGGSESTTRASSDMGIATSAPATPSTQEAQTSNAGRRQAVVGQETVVESVVGQVSGRPIFADEFLEPLEDQLRSEAERLSPDQFISRAREIINARLQQVVINELFLAEAEAALTPEQQMGLLAFLKDLQEKNVAERGGTIFGAQKRIEEEQEMSIEEFEEAQRNETLIRNLIFERISPRVIVSWRDVQREYELRKAEFNPPAIVVLQRLRLDTPDQQEQIDEVNRRLAAGEEFDEVVAALGLEGSTSLVGPDGRFRMEAGDLSTVDVAESLKAALAKIPAQAGSTTEAIAGSNSVQWLHVVEINQPPAKSLFDVQEQLISELQARRFNEEYRKYIDGLFQKGIFDELETMERRLLAVAILRYAR